MKTPEEQRAYMAEYRRKNREKLLKGKKAWYQKNKDWINGVYRQTPEYKAKHLAEVKVYADNNVEKLKEYRQKNSAKRTAKTIEWNRANKERRAAYMKKYQQMYPEKFQEAQFYRRTAITKATPEERLAIIEWIKAWRLLKEVVCHWCHGKFSPKECHSDHVLPLGKDGKHHLDNLVVACKTCNKTKGDMHPDDWIKKIGWKKSD